MTGGFTGFLLVLFRTILGYSALVCTNDMMNKAQKEKCAISV